MPCAPVCPIGPGFLLHARQLSPHRRIAPRSAAPSSMNTVRDARFGDAPAATFTPTNAGVRRASHTGLGARSGGGLAMMVPSCSRVPGVAVPGVVLQVSQGGVSVHGSPLAGMSQCPSCGAWQGGSVCCDLSNNPAVHERGRVDHGRLGPHCRIRRSTCRFTRRTLSRRVRPVLFSGGPLRVVVGVGGVGQGHDAQDGRIRDGVAVFADESFNVGGVAGNDFSVVAD